MRKLLFFLFLLPLAATAQKKQISLEDIYKNRTFYGDYFPGFAGENIESIVNPADVKDDAGKKLSINDHLLNSDKTKMLVFTNRESIYRRSSKAYTYLYDIASKKAIRLDTAKIMHATFSPDGSKIAYVKDNNLYLYDIASGAAKAITTDGKWNHIINGNCDWVYEEEFEFTRAYEWSPKGNYIAYYRFDESDVKEYEFTQFDNSYNKQYTYKYPKAGEANSKVEIHIYNVANQQNVKAQFEQGDIYIPRIKWTQDDSKLVVYWMNRHQDDLKLLNTDAQTGNSSLLYEEKNKYYVEINDDWWFLKDGKNLLFTSEMDGYRHLYLTTVLQADEGCDFAFC